MCLALTHIRNYEDFEMPYFYYTDIFYCEELKKIFFLLWFSLQEINGFTFLWYWISYYMLQFFSLTRRTGKFKLYTLPECMLDGPVTVYIVGILSLL